MNRVWPDATTAVARALIAAGWAVRWEVPSPRPARFLLVRRTGGPADQWRDWAHLDVECWDASVAEVHQAAEQLRSDLVGMAAGLGPIAKVRITGQASIPDELTGNPRVVFGVDVLIRAHDQTD